MLRDRVRSLREANVYEAQRYRHVIGPPLIEPGEGGGVQARTNFMVVRIMHTGETMIFASGRYEDRIVLDGTARRTLCREGRHPRQPPDRHVAGDPALTRGGALEAGSLRLQDVFARFLFREVRVALFDGCNDAMALFVGIAPPVRQPKRAAAQERK